MEKNGGKGKNSLESNEGELWTNQFFLLFLFSFVSDLRFPMLPLSASGGRNKMMVLKGTLMDHRSLFFRCSSFFFLFFSFFPFIFCCVLGIRIIISSHPFDAFLRLSSEGWMFMFPFFFHYFSFSFLEDRIHSHRIRDSTLSDPLL